MSFNQTIKDTPSSSPPLGTSSRTQNGHFPLPSRPLPQSQTNHRTASAYTLVPRILHLLITTTMALLLAWSLRRAWNQKLSSTASGCTGGRREAYLWGDDLVGWLLMGTVAFVGQGVLHMITELRGLVMVILVTLAGLWYGDKITGCDSY